MTAEDLTDWLETTIDDSFDLGWTSRDAAKLIVSRMQAEGLVMVPAQPAADLVDAGETLRQEAAMLLQNAMACAVNHYGEDFAQHGMPGWLADSQARIQSASAALSRYAGGA